MNEIRWKDATTDGDHITKKHTRIKVEAGAMARGVPQDLAHEMAGQTHPLYQNYDPEVIKQFPEYFNSNWRKAWGIP